MAVVKWTVGINEIGLSGFSVGYPKIIIPDYGSSFNVAFYIIWPEQFMACTFTYSTV